MIQNHIVVANTFPTRELMSAGRCNCGDQRTHEYTAANKPVHVGGNAPAPRPRPKAQAQAQAQAGDGPCAKRDRALSLLGAEL